MSTASLVSTPLLCSYTAILPCNSMTWLTDDHEIAMWPTDDYATITWPNHDDAAPSHGHVTSMLPTVMIMWLLHDQIVMWPNDYHVSDQMMITWPYHATNLLETNQVSFSCFSLASTILTWSCCFFSSSRNLSIRLLHRSFSLRFLLLVWKKKMRANFTTKPAPIYSLQFWTENFLNRNPNPKHKGLWNPVYNELGDASSLLKFPHIFIYHYLFIYILIIL